MKLPKPKKTPAGKWYIQLMVDGHRYNGTFDTPEAASYWAAGLKTRLAEDARSPLQLSVSDAMQRYIDLKTPVLSPSTIRGYNHIREALGPLENVQLNQLNQEQVQRWVGWMVREGKSPKSVANAHGLLSAVVGEYRPALTLRTRLPQKVKQEIQIPTEDEIRRLLEAARGTRYELPICLAVFLGLRQSEILGLRWEDVSGDTITIRRAMVVGDDGPVEKGTKTTSGTRRVHLPAHVAALLAAQPRKGDHITTLSGKAVYSGFCRLCDKAGLPHYRFHDLRHFNASLMLATGLPDKYAMKRMGHATNNMLKTVYQHTIREHEAAYDAAMDKALDKLLSPSEKSENKSEKE